MTSLSSEERRARAAEAAADWMMRLESEQLDEGERGEFIDWLRESPLHVAEMLRIGAVHDALSEFRGWQSMTEQDVRGNDPAPPHDVVSMLMRDRPHGPPLLPERQARSHFYSKPMSLLIAASVAAVAIAVTWSMLEMRENHIQTQHNEHREMKLADGSLLEVAPGSELHVKLGRRERRILLDGGEALFHVAKDRERPFIVVAGQTEVRAVGTAFSVGHDSDSVVVTVAEGKVDVSVTERSIEAQDGSRRSLALGAGQQVAIAANALPTQIRSVDSKTELAWARGLLIFDDDPVAEVARRFNSSNRVQIRVLDPELARRPISGVFAAGEPQSFVEFLATAAGVTVRYGSREIVVGGPGAAPAVGDPAGATEGGEPR